MIWPSRETGTAPDKGITINALLAYINLVAVKVLAPWLCFVGMIWDGGEFNNFLRTTLQRR